VGRAWIEVVSVSDMPGTPHSPVERRATARALAREIAEKTAPVSVALVGRARVSIIGLNNSNIKLAEKSLPSPLVTS